MKCCECRKDIEHGVNIGNDRTLCRECAERLEAMPEKCPVCGADNSGDEAVALLLTRATATPAERLGAHSALVHVCSNCGVLYFDGYQRKLLNLLKAPQE